jgi:alpha-1,2-mannosyltransferase
MLKLVYERRSSYNHNSEVASSKIKSFLKLTYYGLFALSYSLAGYAADLIMVNSSWTCSHIAWLWRWSPKPIIVYPPVAVEEFAPNDSKQSKLRLMKLKEETRIIVSVAQFRPEKDHELQLKAFQKLLKDHNNNKSDKNFRSSGGRSLQYDNVRLLLVGSCRDEGDRDRVKALKLLAEELGIRDKVDFVLNVPFTGDNGVIGYLQRSTVGLHTMWNEHFGIGVVEVIQDSHHY